MPDPKLVILYVKSPTVSAAFYADLLDTSPVEASATFAMLPLGGGTMLGLWAAHAVEPAVAAVGGAELAFAADGVDAVWSWHARWSERGLPIAQSPVGMDFGFTFVALDPDGHRLRVFAPGAA